MYCRTYPKSLPKGSPKIAKKSPAQGQDPPVKDLLMQIRTVTDNLVDTQMTTTTTDADLPADRTWMISMTTLPPTTPPIHQRMVVVACIPAWV